MDKKAWWAIISLSSVAAAGYFGWRDVGLYAVQNLALNNSGLWRGLISVGCVFIAIVIKAWLDDFILEI